MSDQPFLRSLKEGETFTGFLLAQEAAFKTSSKGTDYLELKLSDASGDLKAFLWDIRAIEGDMDAVQADAFLKVKGAVSSYNGRMQLRLDKVRFAGDAEVGDFSHFFPVSQRPVPEMLDELDRWIASSPIPSSESSSRLSSWRTPTSARPSPRLRRRRACTMSTWAACWSTPSPSSAWRTGPAATTAP